MKSVALLLMLTVAAPTPEVNDEIVVIARKLNDTKFKFKVGKGQDGVFFIKNCRITRSSGDKEIDAITCRAAEDCAPKFVQKDKKTVLTEGFAKCAHERRTALIEELAMARAEQEAA